MESKDDNKLANKLRLAAKMSMASVGFKDTLKYKEAKEPAGN
eukprot:CAMPEP_0114050916 /NCGR_PEP_ID=MMETSP1339-20121228/67255_1 /TAXON_ID=94617 /ORGANISM="Fibrocapsa japonica" /LENGTH=41 /assembly_acc=CAM_ASM_000762